MKMVHERCQVLRELYTEQGLLATVSASERMRSTLAPYVVPDDTLGEELPLGLRIYPYATPVSRSRMGWCTT